MCDAEDLLMLSGIQHFSFCRRQWALIHIEKQWQENVRTIEGRHIHERTDDPFLIETRGNVIIARAVPIISHQLGLYGIADVVEFINGRRFGIKLKERRGLWQPVPIEYKRGRPKGDERDEVQLCAQAICLEEMLNIKIPEGYIFYNSIRRRSKVTLDECLRKKVMELAQGMHDTFSKGETPMAGTGKNCRLCSMEEVCQPKISRGKLKVKDYIKKAV